MVRSYCRRPGGASCAVSSVLWATVLQNHASSARKKFQKQNRKVAEGLGSFTERSKSRRSRHQTRKTGGTAETQRGEAATQVELTADDAGDADIPAYP